MCLLLCLLGIRGAIFTFCVLCLYEQVHIYLGYKVIISNISFKKIMKQFELNFMLLITFAQCG